MNILNYCRNPSEQIYKNRNRST